MRIKHELVGEWRITGMSEWGRDTIDMIAPGHLTIKSNGSGTCAFCVGEVEMIFLKFFQCGEPGAAV